MGNIEKVLKICKKTHLSLRKIKFHMMMKEGIVLGHPLLLTGVLFDPAKVQVILSFPTPRTLTQVHSFMNYDRHYRCFIQKNSKIGFPLF